MRSEQDLQVRNHPPHHRGVEKIRVVPERGRDLLTCVRKVGNEVKFGCRHVHRQRTHRDTREPRPGVSGVLQHHHDLKERRMTQSPLRVQLLDQPLEGKILMGIGLDRNLAHPSEQLPEGRITRQIRAQNERVDEKANQPFDVAARAPRHGRPHHNILLPRVTHQQNLEGRKQRHEQRRPLALPEPPDPVGHRPGDRNRLRRAPKTLHRRARTAGGQLQDRRSTPELPLPVGKLLFEHSPAQPLPLPNSKIRVLNRQRSQGRRPPLHVRRVERRELVIKNGGGPPIEDDVVNVDEQNVLLLGQAQQHRPHHRPHRKIEGPPRFLFSDPQRLRITIRLRKGAKIDDPQRGASSGSDDLNRVTVDRRKRTAQHLVTLLNRVQSAPERLDVQTPPNAKGPRNVVDGLSRVQPVQKPQTLLPKRKPNRTTSDPPRNQLLDHPRNRLLKPTPRDRPRFRREPGNAFGEIAHRGVPIRVSAHRESLVPGRFQFGQNPLHLGRFDPLGLSPGHRQRQPGNGGVQEEIPQRQLHMKHVSNSGDELRGE